MAKITKFGIISEDQNGNLVLDGFSFDLEFESCGEGPDLINLVIKRIQDSIDGEYEIHEIS